MLIAVLAITSSAQAIFEEDFESYSVGEDVAKNGSGWASRAFDNYGKDNYAGAVVEVDSGTNGTQVGDMVNSSAWGTPYYHLDAADQFSAGSVTFDMLNYGGASRAWFSDGRVGATRGLTRPASFRKEIAASGAASASRTYWKRSCIACRRPRAISRPR